MQVYVAVTNVRHKLKLRIEIKGYTMKANKQQGFSLFLVMILMLVIAMLVIITNQSSLTEMRSSSNEADRKVALSRAEDGLRTAENDILGFESEYKKTPATIVKFTDDCKSGLCQPAKGSFKSTNVKKPFAFNGSPNSGVEAWYRCGPQSKKPITENCKDEAGQTVLDSDNTSIKIDKNTNYIIEYLGIDESNKEIFRITAKARGDNENTNVLLQSYVELTR